MDIVTSGLVALAAALSLIGLLVPLAERVKLPLPTVIAVVGLLIGAGLMSQGMSLVSLEDETADPRLLRGLSIDSQNLLFIFLPPLLFEMSLAVDVRRLTEDIAVVMLMAVVAVLAATVLVGTALALVSPMGLVVCLLFGATISTTDPAAVITIFKRLGAPKRLLVILEGESLLNDAAAIALFTILMISLAERQPIGALDGIQAFGYAFGLGALAGLVMGQMAAQLYPLLRASIPAETSLTLALAYGAFLVAEVVLGASGVVAVVVAGLTTVVAGGVRMGPRNWPLVTGVWNQIGFWANGFILLIGALLTPYFLRDLHWQELGYLVVVVIAAFSARALVLFLMLPAVSFFGFSPSISPKQKTLVWWGGVRGAVTLILTFSLTETTALSQADRSVLGALGCGFVLFTLLVNAATLARVTHLLGLDRLSKADQRLRTRIINATMEEALDHVDDLATRRGMDPALMDDIGAVYDRRMAEIARDHDGDAPFGERLRLGLTILANQERRLYRRRFEDGVIGVTTTRLLQTNADRLADATRLRGRTGYEAMMARLLAFPRLFRPAMQWQRWLSLEWPLARLLARRFDVLGEMESALEAVSTFNAERLAPFVGEDAVENLKTLLDKRAALIRDELEALELQYPQYAKDLRIAALQRAGLRWEEARYGRFFRDGVVGDDLYRTLITDAQRQIHVSRRRPRLDMGLRPKTLITALPLFQDLNKKDMRWLTRRLRPRLVAPGEKVVSKGDRGYEMYFVASGALDVQVEPDLVKLKSGDFFGELAVMGPASRRTADVVALGFCRLLVLRRRDFKALVARNEDIAKKIEQAAVSRMRMVEEASKTRRLAVGPAG